MRSYLNNRFEIFPIHPGVMFPNWTTLRLVKFPPATILLWLCVTRAKLPYFVHTSKLFVGIQMGGKIYWTLKYCGGRKRSTAVYYRCLWKQKWRSTSLSLIADLFIFFNYNIWLQIMERTKFSYKEVKQWVKSMCWRFVKANNVCYSLWTFPLLSTVDTVNTVCALNKIIFVFYTIHSLFSCFKIINMEHSIDKNDSQ